MAKNHVLLYNQLMKIFEGMHKYVWIEFGVWFFILCVAVAGIRIHHYHKQKELVTYQIFMSDVDGLIVGSPVKFMGVQVGYIGRVKIVSNDVYLKLVITEDGMEIPKGSVATVEFNGMGGSKSLEIYPPTEESIASKKIIVVQDPKRLHDSLGLLNDMFDKLGSITNKMSFFAKEADEVLHDQARLNNAHNVEANIDMFDGWIDDAVVRRKEFINKINTKSKKGVENE